MSVTVRSQWQIVNHATIKLAVSVVLSVGPSKTKTKYEHFSCYSAPAHPSATVYLAFLLVVLPQHFSCDCPRENLPFAAVPINLTIHIFIVIDLAGDN